jgi:hypothetical protein
VFHNALTPTTKNAGEKANKATYRSQILQCLLGNAILFECRLAILDHIVHDQAIHIAL